MEEMVQQIDCKSISSDSNGNDANKERHQQKTMLRFLVKTNSINVLFKSSIYFIDLFKWVVRISDANGSNTYVVGRMNDSGVQVWNLRLINKLHVLLCWIKLFLQHTNGIVACSPRIISLSQIIIHFNRRAC